MLPRELLTVYASGAIEALGVAHGFAWQPLAARLVGDLMLQPDAAQRSDSRRQAIMQRGAAAFTKWSADPRGFAADDFKLLVASEARASRFA